MPGTLREGGAPFQTTHWTVVLHAAQDQSDAAARAALTVFCQNYWPPLYTFLRRRGHSPSDAQDLTQAFFVHLLEQNTLARASREKGLLRSFLLGSLRHFLSNEHDRAQTRKRGGGIQIVSMEEQMAETEAAIGSSKKVDETRQYDQAWAETILSQAWDFLYETMVAEGKTTLVEALKPFVIGGALSPPDQEQAAAVLRMPISTFRNALSRLRQQYRNALRTQIARTVSKSSEVDEEMRYLLQTLLL